MKIAEVSQKCGVSADTLRYYERVGLIPTVHRNGSGIRDYNDLRLMSSIWKNNEKFVTAFARLATERNITPAQLASVQALAQGEEIIPVPGAKRRKYLEESAAAVDVTLSSEDLEKIGRLLAEYPHVGPGLSGREN